MRTKNMILASLVLAGSAFGQAAEVAAPAANQINLLDLIKTGGWAMWPLGGFSVFMVTLIVQNFISLRSKALLRSDQVPELMEMMLQKKPSRLLFSAARAPRCFQTPLGRDLSTV